MIINVFYLLVLNLWYLYIFEYRSYFYSRQKQYLIKSISVVMNLGQVCAKNSSTQTVGMVYVKNVSLAQLVRHVCLSSASLKKRKKKKDAGRLERSPPRSILHQCLGLKFLSWAMSWHDSLKIGVDLLNQTRLSRVDLFGHRYFKL